MKTKICLITPIVAAAVISGVLKSLFSTRKKEAPDRNNEEKKALTT